MENFKKYNEKFISNETYKYNPEIVNNLIDRINNCFQKDNDNFAELCYLIHELKEKLRYGFSSPLSSVDSINCYGRVVAECHDRYGQEIKVVFFDDIAKSFGFGKKTIDKMIRVYERFVELRDIAPTLKQQYSGFSRSKLFELLPVSDSQLEKDLKNGKLKDSMTVEEIREYVKFLNGETKDNNVLEESETDSESEIDYKNEENIPMAFNPDEEYSFEFFDKKSKNQLVNICMSYMDAYKKLKEKTLKKTKAV